MDDMIISRAEAKKIGNCNGFPAVTCAELSKKFDFFDSPESADRIPQILLENCGFCRNLLRYLLKIGQKRRGLAASNCSSGC